MLGTDDRSKPLFEFLGERTFRTGQNTAIDGIADVSDLFRAKRAAG